MRAIERLADYDHPLVQEAAERLTGGESTARGKLQRLFYYVRDDIKFGFPRDWNLMKASEVLELRMGQCNTKATLFLALCKAVGIPARLHYGLIKTEIMRGIFPGFALALFPPKASHSWLEVEVEGSWRRIDSYINDKELYQASRLLLLKKGWVIGYSVACPQGECGCEFNIDEEEFVQMAAVVEDHGVWDDPSDYYATDRYTRMNAVMLFFYRLMVNTINKRIERIRKSDLER